MNVILVAGATGQQGSSVIRALSKSEDYLCLALTRNPDSPKAQKLRPLKNDVKATPTGAIWGVFVALEYPGLGANAEGEERQGKNIATVAQEFQVQSYIYTTSCLLPFPDDKPPILERLVTVNYLLKPIFLPWICLGRALRSSDPAFSWRISIPQSPADLPARQFNTACRPTSNFSFCPSCLQTVDDVGRFSRMGFDDPSKLNHKIIAVATAGLDAQERSKRFFRPPDITYQLYQVSLYAPYIG
ncbi:hypothetical protein RSAG8_08827, partial [Rhizoctonia solani AG-8 WAC10335]